jgi:hypothetical protein
MRILVTRRHFLRGSALAAASLALGDFLRLGSRAAAPQPAAADACILIFLNGGMSHLDTFDPKPDQPAEIRGEFAAIRTTAPGILVTEHLPLLARQAHHYAVVRTVSFESKLGNHSPACYHMLTGREPVSAAAVLAPPRPDDHPTMGSAAARLRPTPGTVPGFVMVPDVLFENAHLTPGQFAGWLGSRHEAFRIRSDPSLPGFSVPALTRPAEVSEERLTDRRDLLGDSSRQCDQDRGARRRPAEDCDLCLRHRHADVRHERPRATGRILLLPRHGGQRQQHGMGPL